MTARARPPHTFADLRETEASIQRRIVQTLRAAGCVVIVVNQTSQAKRRTRGTTKGAPDLVVFARDGVVAALEVKKPTYRLALAQAEILVAIAATGTTATIVTSPEDALRAIGR